MDLDGNNRNADVGRKNLCNATNYAFYGFY